MSQPQPLPARFRRAAPAPVNPLVQALEAAGDAGAREILRQMDWRTPVATLSRHPKGPDDGASQLERIDLAFCHPLLAAVVAREGRYLAEAVEAAHAALDRPFFVGLEDPGSTMDMANWTRERVLGAVCEHGGVDDLALMLEAIGNRKALSSPLLDDSEYAFDAWKTLARNRWAGEQDLGRMLDMLDQHLRRECNPERMAPGEPWRFAEAARREECHQRALLTACLMGNLSMARAILAAGHARADLGIVSHAIQAGMADLALEILQSGKCRMPGFLQPIEDLAQGGNSAQRNQALSEFHQVARLVHALGQMGVYWADAPPELARHADSQQVALAGIAWRVVELVERSPAWVRDPDKGLGEPMRHGLMAWADADLVERALDAFGPGDVNTVAFWENLVARANAPWAQVTADWLQRHPDWARDKVQAFLGDSLGGALTSPAPGSGRKMKPVQACRVLDCACRCLGISGEAAHAILDRALEHDGLSDKRRAATRRAWLELRMPKATPAAPGPRL